MVRFCWGVELVWGHFCIFFKWLIFCFCIFCRNISIVPVFWQLPLKSSLNFAILLNLLRIQLMKVSFHSLFLQVFRFPISASLRCSDRRQNIQYCFCVILPLCGAAVSQYKNGLVLGNCWYQFAGKLWRFTTSVIFLPTVKQLQNLGHLRK